MMPLLGTIAALYLKGSDGWPTWSGWWIIGVSTAWVLGGTWLILHPHRWLRDTHDQLSRDLPEIVLRPDIRAGVEPAWAVWRPILMRVLPCAVRLLGLAVIAVGARIIIFVLQALPGRLYWWPHRGSSP